MWESRLSARESPPHPSAVFLGPAPRKLRDHRLNDVPLAMRSRARARSSKPRAFQRNHKDVRGSPDPLLSPHSCSPSSAHQNLNSPLPLPPSPGLSSRPPSEPPPSLPLPPRGVTEEMPLFVQSMEVLVPPLPWIARKLYCPLELLFKRSHMFLERIFSTAEDFRLEEALPVLLQSFVDMREDAWEGLAHLATSPIPQLTRTDPTLAARGLGKMGSYVIPQGLWWELVPESLLGDALNYNVEADPNGGARSVGPGVAEMASTLLTSGVISATPLPPSCFPFIIPKSSEKVSLILSCLGMNERIGDPPTFQLPSWEGVAQLLVSTPRSRPLFCTHVDLTNTFWSFRLPPKMHAAFRFRDRPGGQFFALDRLPFGWKFSPIFGHRILGDSVRPLVPPHMELLHYLNDFLLVGSELAEVQEVTGRLVAALQAASFIVSQKSTLHPVQKFVFG